MKPLIMALDSGDDTAVAYMDFAIEVCHGFIQTYRAAVGSERKHSLRVDSWHPFGVDGHCLYTWHRSSFGTQRTADEREAQLSQRIAECRAILGEEVSTWEIASRLASGARPRWAELHLLFLTHVRKAIEYCNLHHFTHLDLKSTIGSGKVIHPTIAHLKTRMDESRMVLANLESKLPDLIENHGVKARRELRLEKLTACALGLTDAQLLDSSLSERESTLPFPSRSVPLPLHSQP